MNTGKRKPKSPSSPIEAAYDRVGGKWKPVVLYHLMQGTQRFNDLRRQIPNITQRALTLQLRELEADGLVHRKVFQQIPPKVKYSLTGNGQTVIPWLTALHDWAEVHAWSGSDNREKQPVERPEVHEDEAGSHVGMDKPYKTAQTAPTKHHRQHALRARASKSPGRPWGATRAAKIG